MDKDKDRLNWLIKLNKNIRLIQEEKVPNIKTFRVKKQKEKKRERELIVKSYFPLIKLRK